MAKVYLIYGSIPRRITNSWRVLDVTYRGGATNTGAKIYFKNEAFGEQLSKSMLHIVNGLNPTIVENLITLDKGQIRKGKISKAITGEGSKIGDE